MTQRRRGPKAKWTERFLAELKMGKPAAEAAMLSGTSWANAGRHRRAHADFAAQWAESEVAGGARAAAPAVASVNPRTTRGIGRLNRFIDELAASSNVTAAAAVAGLAVSAVYKLRRTDAEFAKRWFAALAEGYDNLEMELLGRLRGGDGGSGRGSGGEGADKSKLDTAAALRCLAAHREAVAREKGRRRLADEVTTIAAINAKIDTLRLNRAAGEAAIRDAEADNARRTRKGRGHGA